MSALKLAGSKGPVALGKRLGKGGEGEVYEVLGQPALVAKLYLRKITAERAEKLRIMPKLLTPTLAALTAWPHDVLSNGAGKVVGFLMPRLQAQDVHEVYGPKSRQRHFPQADWRLLLRVSLNIARAFAVVHEAGHLVADVNHGGVMVSPDATVRLIDCDSFQITHGAKTFLCEVGVEDFTPPELQGGSFRGVLRTANHDNFGLAVLIFRLLMLGRHPFAGRHLGKGDLSIGEAIAQYKYAYSRDTARTQMEIPPTAPPVLAAGPEAAELWEQAFSPAGTQPKARPTAAQWVHALSALEGALAKCSHHPAHYFARGIPCPWCDIQMRTGTPPFLLPGDQAPRTNTGGPFSLEAVWAQITSVQAPPELPPPDIAPGAQPALEAQDYASKKRLFRGLGAATAVGILATGVAIGFPWVVCGLVAGVLYIAIAALAPSIDVSNYADRKKAAESALRDLRVRWQNEASSQAFHAKLKELHGRREAWRALPATRQAEHAVLMNNREQSARIRFLDRFEIERASINGIGPAKKAMLESYGIETAADIERAAVRKVPGFGPALTQRLLDWRRSVEQDFRFNPNSSIDPRDLADLERRMAQHKRELEDALRKGAAELHQLRTTVLSRRQALEGPIRAAAEARAQADADLSAVR